MSKKETEFDRYDRMKRMERESEVQRRKNADFSEDSDDVSKRTGKTKAPAVSRKAWPKQRAAEREEEYDYV